MTDPSPEQPSAPSRRTPRLAITAGVVGFLVAIVGIAVFFSQAGDDKPPASAPPAALDLRGALTLKEGVERAGDTGCRGSGGYDDIATGASVTVYDPTGKIVAAGQLARATLIGGGGLAVQAATECILDFVVQGVPRGHEFYSVEVSHRGKVTFPASVVEGGSVSLTLGS